MQVYKYTGRHRLWVKWSSPRTWPRVRDVVKFHPATWIMHGILALAFRAALTLPPKPSLHTS